MKKNIIKGYHGESRKHYIMNAAMACLAKHYPVEPSYISKAIGLQRCTLGQYINTDIRSNSTDFVKAVKVTQVKKAMDALVKGGFIDYIHGTYNGHKMIKLITRGKNFDSYDPWEIVEKENSDSTLTTKIIKEKIPKEAFSAGMGSPIETGKDPMRHIEAFLYELNLMYENRTKKLQTENETLRTELEKTVKAFEEKREQKTLDRIFPWLKKTAGNQ